METIFQSIYFKTRLLWTCACMSHNSCNYFKPQAALKVAKDTYFTSKRICQTKWIYVRRGRRDVMSKRFCGTLDTKDCASIVIYRYLQKILNLSSVAGIGPSMDTLRCESNAPNRWQPQSRHPEQEGLAHISQGSVDDRMETVRCEKQKRKYSFDLKGGLCNLVRALLELQILKVRC